uniref:Uncharacterized protein n=1 Tax=Octopus bimaculoides TaxID=37653 RepID=A0A0L8GHG5_OCTBM
MVALFKVYNLKQHHQTKHGKFWLSEEECRKKLKNQQTIFTKQSTFQDSATEASFMVAYNLTKNKPFSDGEFVKQCLIDCASILCPDARRKFKTISLSRRTMAWHIDLISNKLTEQLNTVKSLFGFLWHWLRAMVSKTLHSHLPLSMELMKISSSQRHYLVWNQ